MVEVTVDPQIAPGGDAPSWRIGLKEQVLYARLLVIIAL
jgi:hypothetical protein